MLITTPDNQDKQCQRLQSNMSNDNNKVYINAYTNVSELSRLQVNYKGKKKQGKV